MELDNNMLTIFYVEISIHIPNNKLLFYYKFKITKYYFIKSRNSFLKFIFSYLTVIKCLFRPANFVSTGISQLFWNRIALVD